MAARPERVAISPLGVTCEGGLGKNSVRHLLAVFAEGDGCAGMEIASVDDSGDGER